MSKTLNKDELTIKISEDHDLTKAKSREIVDFIFDEMTDTLKEDGEVSIYNFGKFKIRHRPEREGFNPSTKEKMMIESAYVPAFHPSKNLKDVINGHNQ